MGSTITVRNLPPDDKSWLQREARLLGLSMEALVRRIIRDRREQTQKGTAPSDVARRYFGPSHGIELSLRRNYGYRQAEFPSEEQE